jgi:hypothetical protein
MGERCCSPIVKATKQEAEINLIPAQGGKAMGYIFILILTTIGVYLFGERLLSVPDTIHAYLWRWWEFWFSLSCIVAIILVAIGNGGMSSMLPWAAASFSGLLGLLFALALIVSHPTRTNLFKQRKHAH